MKPRDELPAAGGASGDGRPAKPSFREALRVWLKIGLLSFGGPAGQIALMHRELVEKRRWLSDRRFMHALNYCMLLPGPEAQQLAVYTGWLLHRTRGGLVAGLLFVLPGALLMWLISYLYLAHGRLPWVEGVFYGLKAAVMAVVVSALLRIAGKVLTHPVMWVLAGASFTAIFALAVPFPVIVVCALGIGLWMGARFPAAFGVVDGAVAAQADPQWHVVADDDIRGEGSPGLKRTASRIALWLALWLLPLAICLVWLGPSHVLTRQGMFFSKAALVTFGGAYAVLPYVAQQAVEVHGWLDAGQMMDGLGLAETTPGPLILVLQFVGFAGGWHEPGGLPPLAMATLAAGMTLWCTFIPGYLFIFAGAPVIERGRGYPAFDRGLSAVTAAVAGVMLNLALWFAWHVVVPEPGRFDAVPLVLAGLFLWLLRVRNWGVIPVAGLAAAAGLALHVAGPG
jgi:chromate transporter